MITIEEIAAQSDISIKNVRRDVASGLLPSYKKNNRYLITPSDFEKWKIDKENLKEKKVSIDFLQDIIPQKNTVNFIDISEEIENIDGWNNKNDLGDLNFIDLFAGAGGLSCGLVMAGMKPVYSVEILESAVATYKRNFCQYKGFDEKVETRDIRNDTVKNELAESLENKHIHLIAGGFPCQGFSMAGNRIVTDPRNSLYEEMLKIVKRIKPDFVLMENVEGLRSMMGGKVEQKILSDYKNIGYNITVTTLNSADYGVPQTRKRVIFIGNRIGKTNCHPLPILKPENYKTVKDGIERFVNFSENKAVNHIFTKHSSDMLEKLKKQKEGESLYKNYSDAWKKVFWNKPSTTVKENHGGVNVHPLFPRVMTPRELAALQSFPDDFIFEGSKKWQLVQIGNAVPPLLGKAIGLAIKKVLTEDYNEEEIIKDKKEYQLSLF